LGSGDDAVCRDRDGVERWAAGVERRWTGGQADSCWIADAGLECDWSFDIGGALE